MDLVEVLKEIKVIDLTPLINTKTASTKDIKQCSDMLLDSFHKYGVAVLKDPRVPFEKNDIFIDMMEEYFKRSTQSKMKQVRKELSYQIGATPSNTERARNHCARVETLDPNHKPITQCPPEADPKWRYFWRLGSKGNKNKNTQFQVLNSDNVIPHGIPNWTKICNSWGNSLLESAKTVSEGLSIGLKLPRDYFKCRMNNAPHLLAPTATDLVKYNKKGTVIASYHYDLNFLTVHGKSRYPGLYIWLRDGRKVKVKIPKGCLLAQAGKQLEIITGGYIYAGFHEVVINNGTLNAVNKYKKEGRPLWRISSTMFSHINSNVILKLLSQFRTEQNIKKYPNIKTGDQVINELKAINLSHSKL